MGDYAPLGTLRLNLHLFDLRRLSFSIDRNANSTAYSIG